MRWLYAAVAVAGSLALAALPRAWPTFDGLPHAPLLSTLLGWPPALSFALGAAGAFLMMARAEEHARQLLAAAGTLLLLAALFPQVDAGELRVPLIASLEGGISSATAALLIGASGVAFLFLATTKLAALVYGRIGVAALAVLPLWHLGHLISGDWDCIPRAILSLAFSAAVAWAVTKLAHLSEVALVGEWPAVVLLSALYWLLKLQGVGYSASDEGLYFYAAKVWAEGVWPYRDFFFSHPPVHLLVPMLVYKVFGFSFLAGKLIGPMAGFGSGLVLWRSTRQHFGVIAGVSALGLFWLSTEVLWSTTTFTGAETATLLLTLGVSTALDRKAIAAGVWFGLASATAVYASSGILTFAVLLAFAPRDQAKRWWAHDAAKMLAAFLVVFGVINLIFWCLAGSKYIDGVYRYHLLKSARDPNQQAWTDGPLAIIGNLFALLGGREVRTFLSYHAPQVWLAVAAPIVLALRPWCGLPVERFWPPREWWKSGTGRIPILLLSTLGGVLMLGQLSERYDHYFMILFPTLVPVAGFTVAELVRWGDAAITRRSPMPWLRPGVALALVCLWLPIDTWASATAFPEEIKHHGEIVAFPWTPAPVLPELGEVVHTLFWASTRVRGDLESSVQSFLKSKKRFFSTAPEIAAYIRENTTPADTITGGSDYAPLIALLAGRRLAGNQVDTNTKVFATGIVPEAQFWKSVCADRPAFIVSADLSHFSVDNMPTFPIAADFAEDRVFDDPSIRYHHDVRITLFRRLREPPARICATE